MAKRIAIVGTGIAGLTAAYLLSRKHEVSVFEQNDYIGGHTHTVEVECSGRTWSVDTGFIVFNDWTYPNFIKLMSELGVSSQISDMSFSVRSEQSGLEYNGTSLNGLFAQRTNLLRPAFLRMVRDILRFNRETRLALEQGTDFDSLTLGDYLQQQAYSNWFRDYYIVPMGAAIWSSGEAQMMQFPLGFFLRFFNNHGMLSVDDRPVWRVIQGGSSRYIGPLTRSFRDRIHLNTPVKAITRQQDGVVVTKANGQQSRFDEVVLATHSDQALSLLADVSDAERSVLEGLRYQANEVVLHTDTRLLPTRKRAWASWNYHVPETPSDQVALTYNMNLLQGIDALETFCVTLNRTQAIDPDKVLRRFEYSHPVYSLDAIRAQARFAEISGVNRTHFCGAYWFNGFHEDGVNSALRVAAAFGEKL
jgi:predicted NAD/FAD-binding protein